MRAKCGRDPMAGSKKVTLKFIIGYDMWNDQCVVYTRRQISGACCFILTYDFGKISTF